jgi:putative ATPase
MDLFDHAMHERMKTEAPLAARMRPRSLDEFVGQEEALQATSVGPGKLLRWAERCSLAPEARPAVLLSGRSLTAIILWGPPGTGKSMLCMLHPGVSASVRLVP